MLPFLIVIDQRSLEGLHVLLMQAFNHLWHTEQHLLEALRLMRQEHWLDGVKLLAMHPVFRTAYSNETSARVRESLFSGLYYDLANDLTG